MEDIQTLIEQLQSPDLRKDFNYKHCREFLDNNLHVISKGIRLNHLKGLSYYQVGLHCPLNNVSELGEMFAYVIRQFYPIFNGLELTYTESFNEGMTLTFDWSFFTKEDHDQINSKPNH